MSDDRAVAHYTPEACVPATRQSDTLLAQVIAAAKDPSIDADKMRALAELVNSQQDRDLKAEFNRDLNAAMMEMPVITKTGRIEIRDKNNTNLIIQSTRFAKFEDIDRVCRPILRAHNLAIRFDIGSKEGGGVTCTPIITHTNGWVHTGLPIPAPIESSGSKNNVQGVGSTITYLRRYAYCSALNIVTEGQDDDGNLGRAKQVEMPQERENLVLAEARAAFDAGRYQEHFASLGPKDRAWLMQSGHHQAFGGQVALPQRSSAAAAATDQTHKASTPPPPPPPPPPSAEKPKAQTVRQWVDGFKADVTKCVRLDDLDVYMDEARESLDKIKTKNEGLWQECQDAYRGRRQALESGAML